MPLVFPHFILHTSIHFILPLHPVICSTHNHQEPGDEFMQLCSVSFSCPLVFMCMCYLYRHTVHRCARKGWAAHHELARRLSDSPSPGSSCSRIGLLIRSPCQYNFLLNSRGAWNSHPSSLQHLQAQNKAKGRRAFRFLKLQIPRDVKRIMSSYSFFAFSNYLLTIHKGAQFTSALQPPPLLTWIFDSGREHTGQCIA